MYTDDEKSRRKSDEMSSQDSEHVPHNGDAEKHVTLEPIRAHSTIDDQLNDAASTITAPPLEETIEDDPNIVFWDGLDDKANPKNWPMWRKWCTILIVSMITMVIALASSACAPGVPDIMNEFHQHSTVLSGFIVSVYVLGFAVGPLIIAPMSEMYGRLPLYHISGIAFTVFNIGCAASQDLTQLIILRFFTGCFGSAPLALGGGTVADLMPPEMRANALSIWMLGPTLGPAIGPIVGGFVCINIGWRWMFWIQAIVSGAAAVFVAILMRETYAPTILARKAARLRKKTGNPNLRSKLESKLSAKALFLHSIIRPTKLLFMSPIVLLLSMYVATVYAYLYLLFTTVPTLFEKQYHWRNDLVGLAFLGIGVGCFIGQFAYTAFENRHYQKHKELGDLVPEHRLTSMIFGSVCLPVSLFWYAWSTEEKVHWICPIFAMAIFGIGLLSIFMAASNYLVDCFTTYAASAMAANTVLRSILATVLPIAGTPMYNKLGYGWGSSVLGFIALAFLPVPLLFLKYGQRLRTNRRFQVNL